MSVRSTLGALVALSMLATSASAQTCSTDQAEGGFIVPATIVFSTTQISCVTMSQTGVGSVTTTLSVAWQCEWGDCASQTKDFEKDSLGSGQCETRDNNIVKLCAPLHSPVASRDFASAEISWVDSKLGSPCELQPVRYDLFSCPRCLGCVDRESGGRSPILVSLEDGRFELTDLEGGVFFDLDHDGEAEALSWTAPFSDDGFLVLDRNENQAIDGGNELFGDVTPQPPGGERNGFRALALFDEPLNGGNGDGFLSAADAIFSSLEVWVDRDHDGVSAPSELQSLEALGIASIELAYHEASRRDRHGNEFRFRGRLRLESGGVRPLWDVYVLTE